MVIFIEVFQSLKFRLVGYINIPILMKDNVTLFSFIVNGKVIY